MRVTKTTPGACRLWEDGGVYTTNRRVRSGEWVLEVEPACGQGRDPPSSSPGPGNCRVIVRATSPLPGLPIESQGKPNATLLLTHTSQGPSVRGAPAIRQALSRPRWRQPPHLTGEEQPRRGRGETCARAARLNLVTVCVHLASNPAPGQEPSNRVSAQDTKRRGRRRCESGDCGRHSALSGRRRVPERRAAHL